MSELRLARAADLEAANAVLARYLPRHNRRFAVPPADDEAAWRPWSGPRPAEAVFCFRYERRAANDGTVSGRATGWRCHHVATDRPGRVPGCWSRSASTAASGRSTASSNTGSRSLPPTRFGCAPRQPHDTRDRHRPPAGTARRTIT